MTTEFLKGLEGDDEILRDATPKIVFIGRSNVGKSSLINALTGSKIARTSPTPGHTRQINVYLINRKFHLIDLPGYGFSRGSLQSRADMGEIISKYLFSPKYEQKKVVMIVDGSVGMTVKDISMFHDLVHFPKDFIVAVSKIDKMTQAEYHKNLAQIKTISGAHEVFPFSSTEKTGLEALEKEIFN
jgi:GTP-binding protein